MAGLAQNAANALSDSPVPTVSKIAPTIRFPAMVKQPTPTFRFPAWDAGATASLATPVTDVRLARAGTEGGPAA